MLGRSKAILQVIALSYSEFMRCERRRGVLGGEEKEGHEEKKTREEGIARMAGKDRRHVEMRVVVS